MALGKVIRDTFSEEVTSNLRRHSEKEPVHVRREKASVRGQGKSRCKCPEVAVSLEHFKEQETGSGQNSEQRGE